MSKTILLIGTLDTKGAEYLYVRDLIARRQLHVLTIDAGVIGEPVFAPDFSAAQVAEKGGSFLSELRQQADRGVALEVMMRGASRLAVQLYEEGGFQGVLALGGSGGTAIATAAMRELPVGFPKVMVSTIAAGDVQAYVGVKDIAMMYSVTDIAGLNRLSRRILANAVGMICGMVEQEQSPEASDQPLIAATMFGVTTPCVDILRKRLESSGYEVMVFHATGSGGQAMESLIDSGFVSGVADVTTTEWCDELVGGCLSAGPRRLEAAGRRGIPQVVSCGALDMVNFLAFDTVPVKFKDRTLYRHNAHVTLMRTTPDECAQLGRIIAGKLNRALGPTTLFLTAQRRQRD
ncbi:MAG: Tm-1-like ATP-binding domain-containing protein [Pyrinomonadaceae bacterium]